MSQTIASWDTLVFRNESLTKERCGDRDARSEPAALITEHQLHVEAVDTNHPAWGEVLRAIVRAGHRQTLMLNDHGRLSARQTVLAAFDRERVVGHLCFRVEPVRSPIGRATVRAKLDSIAVEPSDVGKIAETMLKDTADQRARLMNCRGPQVTARVAC